MSEIDTYQHECIGIVLCPTSYRPFVVGTDWDRSSPLEVSLYLLHEDALDSGFPSKKGDLILGGGSGESPALRISMPEALIFFTTGDWPQDLYAELAGQRVQIRGWYDRIYQAYWTPTTAYMFGEGYVKLGWRPQDTPMEIWLVEHILAFILKAYPERWGDLRGTVELDEDGSICRLPTEEEKRIL